MTPNLIEVVKRLKELDTISCTYLDSVPSEFTGIVIDNPYAESQYKMLKLVSVELFGDMFADIEWFLSDWSPEKNNKFWLADGSEIFIKTEEDYYEYLKGQ